MHASYLLSPTLPAHPAPGPLALLRRHARLMQHAANTGSLAVAMPVLRRVHAAGVLPEQGLTALYLERANLQRKHFLRTLAREAGHGDWESLMRHAGALAEGTLDYLRFSEPGMGTLNAWFADADEAAGYQAAHGGRIVRYGRQAVVIPEDAPALPC